MLRLLSAVLLVTALAAAQNGEPQAIRVNVDLVNVYFSVCNHKGRLITNLDRESFAVTEDGRPQIITNFSRETDVPLTIILLMDTSGSVWNKLRFEKEAAEKFLYATLRPGHDKAALVTFDHTFELRQGYTDDPAVLAAAVRHVIAGGGTRLYDALHFVMEDKLSAPEERKVIVLITDGDDKSSVHSPQDVVDLAQRNNVSIYAISMNGLGMKAKDSERSDNILDELASETGGMGFFPTRMENIASNFQKIADDLRSQYTIGYRSSNQKRDGTFRKIGIEASKPRYSVRTRSGYYAPTQVIAGNH